MAANNEVGTIFPTRELGGICKNKGVLFHVDAAQAIGKIPVDVEAWNADLVSLSAHKFHGPKGVGALYIRRQNPRVILEPLHVGGGQEIGQRAGTLNVPGIVGMGIACALIDLNQHTPYVCGLRDRLLHRLLKEVPNARLNGSEQARLPNNINIFLPVLNPGETLLSRFPQIAFSIGSACSTGIGEYSHVLKAMGLDRATALASARFGLSRYTTLEEIDQTADVLCASAVPKL
jgi:cysteine desulfurase